MGKSLERYQAIFEHGSDGMYMLNPIHMSSGVELEPEVVNACQKLFLEKKIDLYR